MNITKQDTDTYPRHRSNTESRVHRLGFMAPSSSSVCDSHKQSHMYFCSDCEKLLCSLCLSNGSHRQHQWAELADSLGHLEASIEKSRRSAQVALQATTQQKSNLRAEQDRLSNLCTKARSAIRSRHTAIRHQLDAQRASLYLLHEQTDCQHRYLVNQKHPSEILQPELSKVQAIKQAGEITIVKIRSQQVSALGKVTTAMGNLKKVQQLVKTTEKEWLHSSLQSLPQYDAANSDTLESLVRSFGSLEVTMQPVVPKRRRNNNTKVPLLHVPKDELAKALSPRHARPNSSYTLPRSTKDSTKEVYWAEPVVQMTAQTDRERYDQVHGSHEDLDDPIESYDEVRTWNSRIHKHIQDGDDDPIYEQSSFLSKNQ